jgi:hypothetical protein
MHDGTACSPNLVGGRLVMCLHFCLHVPAEQGIVKVWLLTYVIWQSLKPHCMHNGIR